MADIRDMPNSIPIAIATAAFLSAGAAVAEMAIIVLDSKAEQESSSSLVVEEPTAVVEP